MNFQKDEKHKKYIKSWYLLNTLNQISDKNEERYQKLLSGFWQSSEKLSLCLNKVENDKRGFHYLSRYNQSLSRGYKEKSINEITALRSYRAGKQQRLVAYNDPVSKQEWKKLDIIRNNCRFIEEIKVDDKQKRLYENYRSWNYLDEFMTSMGKHLKNQNL